jgi:hypothetical protein
VMDAAGSAFDRLEPAADGEVALEGAIWAPGR